jgi:putative intracellular protease/amidase
MSPPVTVAVVAFAGFNELDVAANLHILNRVTWARPHLDLVAHVVGPAPTLRSMYGLDVTVQCPLDSVVAADAVVIGSGGTLDAIDDPEIMTALGRIDPAVQVVGSQCSGALLLHRLGLPGDRPACSDDKFRPVLEAAGMTVLDAPFVAHGNVATAGGCLASAYLSAWLLSRLVDPAAAADTLATVAPVGRQHELVADVMKPSAQIGRCRDRRRPRRHHPPRPGPARDSHFAFVHLPAAPGTRPIDVRFFTAAGELTGHGHRTIAMMASRMQARIIEPGTTRAALTAQLPARRTRR